MFSWAFLHSKDFVALLHLRDMDFQKYQGKVPSETDSRKGPNSLRDLA